MARDGYKIFDSDTHVGPFVDIIDKYISAADKARLGPWEQYKAAHKATGHVTYTKGARSYRRRLGTAGAAEEGKNTYMAGFTGAHKRPPSQKVDDDPAERIKDMEIEGVDVNLTLPSGWFGTWTAGDDVALEMAMYRAYHQWMADYCGKFPDRLGGVILVSSRDVPGSVEEIKRWAKARWAWGVLVYAPVGSPLDHPGLEPVWKAAADADLSITLHTFTVMPPYAPGGLDNWENLWLQRSAAHPWCGMRNMASLIGSGVMERYPDIRIGTLEAGHGWLPFWMKRIDEHYDTIRSALPENVKKPSEYVLSGRYFQSIEVPEGEALTKAVIDLVGDGVLMYASDYPHSESHFPETVDTVLKWTMPKEKMKKLLWDNAVKFYPRCGLK
jgi:predicted TIM-barrel fold metal-dependent hydrolase